jgi:GNAT superfamily N-acetyltransferase
MEFSIKNIDITKDKDLIQNYHCKVNFACDSDWAIKVGYETYSKKWFLTNQPEEFYNTLIESIRDTRTIAIICEINGEHIGYLWVKFEDVLDYNLTIAEIEDLFIEEKWRGNGFAKKLLNYAESKCKESGANILRSGTGINNIASIKIHEKSGFKKYRVELEKLL